MRSSSLSVVVWFGFIVAACGVTPKKEVAHAALSTMSTEDRRETFEATVRVLDEKPELVDEFYVVAKQHPVTFTRFIANTARDLHEPEMAKITGEHLARHPDSLERTLVATTDAIVPRPDARSAMTRAMSARAKRTVDILTDDPDTLARILTATLEALEKKPAARTAAIAAVRKNRAQIVSLVKNDPELSKEIAEELVGGVVDKVKAKAKGDDEKK